MKQSVHAFNLLLGYVSHLIFLLHIHVINPIELLIRFSKIKSLCHEMKFNLNFKYFHEYISNWFFV